ncbi:MAG: hypothetical protein LQ343_007379 [Gyalolechia ehrenbergii]|nr:MAG: hypothetical protein LQ343_007379 [Gyalolechia ehrenbergii]
MIKSLQQDDLRPRVVALTGMGGIGKTEILLELAFRLRNVTNVFSVKPTDAKSVDHALLQIAVSIGHELLSIRFKNADLASIWRGYSSEERIQAFKTWLAHKDNQPNIFIVDDLDGLSDENLIRAALPSQAQVILYSARDPTIMESLDRYGKAYHIPDMEIDEMALLMNATLRRTGSRVSDSAITEIQLESIAKIVSGHALGACRAITYILNVLSQTSVKPATTFIQAFSSSNWEARRQFIEYKPRLGLSIMETFTTSLERMQNHKDAAMKLLEVMAFLSDNSKSLHSRDFFAVRRPWLEQLRSDLPDYDTFAQGSNSQNEYLLELERVSIGVRPVVPGPLQIHPLWIECIQRAEHTGRLRWLRQILLLCYASFLHAPEQYHESLEAFMQNVALIAARFNIPHRDLCANDDIWSWFKSSIAQVEEGYAHSPALSTKSNDTTSSKVASINIVDDLSSPVGSSESQEDIVSPVKDAAYSPKEAEPPGSQTAESQNSNTSLNQIGLLHEQCKAAAAAIASSNPEKLSEEAFAKQVQTYLGLLRRLQGIEESGRVQAIAHDDRTLCIEIYDLLIQMAPAFRSKSPMLSELLRKRKEELVKTST